MDLTHARLVCEACFLGVASEGLTPALNPSVQGVGIGNKFVHHIATEERVLQVFVDRKRHERFLKPEHRIPAEIEGVPTDVVETGIFRGTLDVRAKTITDEMCLAAARELAKIAEDTGLREDYIVPTMEQEDVFSREAVAVGLKAIEQGIARVKKSRQELFERARDIIHRARAQAHHLMETGFIRPPP